MRKPGLLRIFNNKHCSKIVFPSYLISDYFIRRTSAGVRVTNKFMKRPTRIRLRISGELTILLLLIIYILAHLTELANTPMWHGVLMTALSKPYNGYIKAGPVRAHLDEFAAEGWDVSAEDDRGRYLGKAPHVKVWFNRFSFFWRRVRPERVEIDKPVVHLWTDPDHVFIFKRWKRPPRRLNPIFRTRAGNVIAHNGTLTYDYYPEPKPLHLYLEGINVRAHYTETTPYIQGTINRLYLKYDFFDDWFYNLTVQGLAGSEFCDAHRITATYLNMPLTISGRLDGFQRKNPRLNVRVQSQGRLGDLLRYFHYNANPPGDFAIDAFITGLSDDYYINGGFTSSYGIIEGQRYDNFKGKFTYHKSVVTVEKFTMRMYGMFWEGSGWYNVSSGEFHGHGTMSHRGRPMRFDVSGRLDTDKSIMTFTSIVINSADAQLSGHGRWYVSRGTLEMQYRLVIRDLARELAHWGVEHFAGSLDVRGAFSGPVRNPLVSADGQVSNLEWYRAFFGAGPISAKLKAGDISAKLTAHDKDAMFEASAVVPLLRNGDFASLRRNPFTFEIIANGFKITKRLMETDFTGEASGELSGGGTSDNLRAHGSIKLKNARAWGQTIATATARLEMTERGIAFEDLEATLPSGDKGAGRIWTDWDLNYELTLESHSIRLTSLDKVKSSGMPIEGNVAFTAEGKGNFEKIKINAATKFSSLKYDGIDLIGGQMIIYLDGTVATLDGTFYHGISINGAYDFNDGAFHNFIVTFFAVPLKQIFALKGMQQTSGQMTGTLTMNGGAAGWGDVDYHFLLTSLEISFSNEIIRNAGPLRIEIGPSGGRQDIHLLVKGGRLDITGVIGADKVWELDATGKFDLGMLVVLTHQIRRASGMASLNAHLSGPTEDIRLSGLAEIQGGSMRFRGYQAEFTGINGQFIFHPDHIHVDQLLGIVNDEGDFVFDGDVYYEGFRIIAFNMKFDATGLPFSQQSEYKLILSPSLTLTGDLDEPVLAGNIQIAEGRYIKDFRIEKQFVEVNRETAPRKEPTGFMKKLTLNVQIVNDGNFRVHNNLADLFLRAALTVKGNPTDPHVEGTVDGVEGKLYYGGTTFTLDRAKLDFSDPTSNDAYVDVSARAEIRSYEVRLSLVGRLSHMLLSFSSVPQLDDQNILSLLTFGKLTDELSRNESDTLLTIPIFFAPQLGPNIRQPLEKYTGINIFNIETQPDRPGARVTLGGDLSKRLSIQYSAETTGENPIRQSQVIYRITDKIWLLGTQNNLGIYSFKLNFHFEVE